jgi:hypothetical protein
MKRGIWIAVNFSMIFLFKDFLIFFFLRQQRIVKKILGGKIDCLHNTFAPMEHGKRWGREELSRAKFSAVFGRRNSKRWTCPLALKMRHGHGMCKEYFLEPGRSTRPP